MMLISGLVTKNSYKTQVIRYCVLALVLFSSPLDAGLLNLITKISKTTKNPDIDLPLNKLAFPDEIKGFAPVTIKPDADGQWVITRPDGARVKIEQLVKESPGHSDKPVLVIQASDLPKDLANFDNLPHDWPVFIQGRKGRLFELRRGEPAALIYKKVRLKVASIDNVQDALWMLQRPSVVKAVRLVEVNNNLTTSLPARANGSRFSVESVAADHLIDSIKSLNNQKLVLSGKIVDGKLQAVDKNSAAVSLQRLQKIAAENDVHLVVIDSQKPDLVLKKVSRSLSNAVRNNNDLSDTTGDFFNRLGDSKNSNYIELITSSNDKNQIAIQWMPDKGVGKSTADNLSADDLWRWPVHLLLHSVTVHMPDKERSRELGARIIPQVNSWVQFYIILMLISSNIYNYELKNNIE